VVVCWCNALLPLLRYSGMLSPDLSSVPGNCSIKTIDEENMAMNAATRVHRWARDCFLIQQVMGQKLKKF